MPGRDAAGYRAGRGCGCGRGVSAVLAAGGFAGAASDGPLLVAIGVSFLVGILGFISPCCLPLVPGYLSYVAGLSGPR